MNTADQSILWRRLDTPGHEAARLSLKDGHWQLTGSAVFLHQQQSCRLDYLITCDEAWLTRSARVAGWVGDEAVEVELNVDDAGRWSVNKNEKAAVEGCIDLDLNFSPSTNLLPIRRLALSIGQESGVRAAWLRFPGFELEPLEQLYRRIDESTYRYESAGGSFVRDLQVNGAGFVTDYPHIWKVEQTP